MEEAAIRVLPARLAKGEIGRHYRLGWKEKEKAGKSLYGPEPEHRYTLPENMRYDFGGRGLVIDPPSAPDGKSAIDALNKGLPGGK